MNFIRIGLGRRRKKKVAAEIEDEDVELKEDVTTVEISLAEAETPKTWFFSFRAISSLRSVSFRLAGCELRIRHFHQHPIRQVSSPTLSLSTISKTSGLASTELEGGIEGGGEAASEWSLARTAGGMP